MPDTIMARIATILVLFFSILIKDSLAGSTCYQYSYRYGSSRYYNYCSEGCCGYSSARYCCANPTLDIEEYHQTAGIVVGCVFGGIVFLGIMVSLVICAVCHCTQKNGGRSGRIIAPVGGTNNIAMVTIASPRYTQTPSTYPTQSVPVYGAAHILGNYPRQIAPIVQPPPYPGVHMTHIDQRQFVGSQQIYPNHQPCTGHHQAYTPPANEYSSPPPPYEPFQPGGEGPPQASR